MTLQAHFVIERLRHALLPLVTRERNGRAARARRRGNSKMERKQDFMSGAKDKVVVITGASSGIGEAT
jgi:hypothetical protein